MHTAYIGMGANLPSPAGPPEITLAQAALRLQSLGHITARSSLYSTEPVGLADQPRFINAVVSVETGLAPRTLLTRLHAIERDFGRDRVNSIRNGPRTLDLDILLLGDLCLSEAGLVVPHSRLAERAFVLVPLNEIAPRAVDPRSNTSVSALLRALLAHSANADAAVIRIQSEAWAAAR